MTDQSLLRDTLEKIGIDFRHISKLIYNKPYPDWIDKLLPFSRGYKVPEFVLFLGEDKHQSSIEHVARFTVQYREASANDFWRLRLQRDFLGPTQQFE